GKTLWLWMGRTRPHLGISLQENGAPAKWRRQDVVVQWLRSRLKGKWIVDLDLSNSAVSFVTLDSKLKYCFGYIDGMLQYSIYHLVNYETWECIQKSIEGESVVTDHIKGDPLKELEEWGEVNEAKLNRKSNQKIERKIKAIKKDIVALKTYPLLYEMAQDLNNLESQNEINCGPYKFKFKKTLNTHQKADEIYRKAKRLKAAIEIQENRLNEAIANAQNYEQQSLDFEPSSLGWRFEEQKKKQATNDRNEAIDFEEFQLGKMTIAIGKNAQSNDWLRKNWA